MTQATSLESEFDLEQLITYADNELQQILIDHDYTNPDYINFRQNYNNLIDKIKEIQSRIKVKYESEEIFWSENTIPLSKLERIK